MVDGILYLSSIWGGAVLYTFYSPETKRSDVYLNFKSFYIPRSNIDIRSIMVFNQIYLEGNNELLLLKESDYKNYGLIVNSSRVAFDTSINPPNILIPLPSLKFTKNSLIDINYKVNIRSCVIGKIPTT
ncbi:MAG: hypothetical protein [Caudoviricetes sp.]|nr:MAG: hypothetical protein [Caudoviricetes sp.]